MADDTGARQEPMNRRAPMLDILVVKVASRGDLLLSAPAIASLREQHPSARITLLVGSTCEDVARHLPHLDQLAVIDDRLLFGSSRWGRMQGAFEMLRVMRAWRQGGGGREEAHGGFRHTQVVILHRDWRYGSIARLAGIPVRRGFASPRGSRFLTDAYVAGEREHHVSQYVGVAGGRCDAKQGTIVGAWEFLQGERDRCLAKAISLGFDPMDGAVALGFGGGRNVKTRTALKCWPIERWRQLAAELEGDGRRVVWLGDAEDGASLGSAERGTNLTGKLSVSETAAVVSACGAVVANDTLVMHLGEAMGIPTIGLFGPTDPEHTGPRGPNSMHLWAGADLTCSPCHRDGFFPICEFNHQCMRNMDVARVRDTVDSVLDSARTTKNS